MNDFRLQPHGRVLIGLALLAIAAILFDLLIDLWLLVNSGNSQQLQVGLGQATFAAVSSDPMGRHAGLVSWALYYLGLLLPAVATVLVGSAMTTQTAGRESVAKCFKRLAIALLMCLILQMLGAWILITTARTINPDIIVNINTDGMFWLLLGIVIASAASVAIRYLGALEADNASIV